MRILLGAVGRRDDRGGREACWGVRKGGGEGRLEVGNFDVGGV